MPHHASSNNTKAGAFLMISLIIALLVIIQLAGLLEVLKPHRSYMVTFSLVDGAPGLNVGSEVRIAGQKVGQVTRVTLQKKDGDDVIDAVLVQIEIERRYSLFDNAVAFLEQPLFGSASTLNFAGVGGGPGAAILDPGGIIEGRRAVPSFLASAGYGDEQKEQVKSIVERINRMAANFEDFAAKLDGQVLADAQEAVADVRALTDDLKERYPLWFDRADEITEDIASASDRANSTVAEAQEFVASLQEMVDENRPRVDSTVEGADALVERLNSKSIELLDEMLADGRLTAQDARDAVNEVSQMMRQSSPDMRKAIANARLASDQLKLTMGEVRRAPWRVLQRPDKKELEYELLYDSARTYASAISDLRAASEALEVSMNSSRVETQLGQENLKGLLEDIEVRFNSYQEAEARFLDLLITQ